MQMKKVLLMILVITLFGGGWGIKKLWNSTNEVEEMINIANEEEAEIVEELTEESSEEDTIVETKEKEHEQEQKSKQEVTISNENKNVSQKKANVVPKETKSTSSSEPSKEIPNSSEEKVVAQTKPKKLTKDEAKEYLKKNNPSFRYDFDTKKQCQDEGNAWMNYGWIYNCTYVEVPNYDIKPYMLIISTGKFFCDGTYTKNEEYYWENSKISSISYLRQIGYPCENIDGTN